MQPVETVAVRGPMTPVRMITRNDGVDDLLTGDGETSLGKTPLDVGEHLRFDRPHASASCLQPRDQQFPLEDHLLGKIAGEFQEEFFVGEDFGFEFVQVHLLELLEALAGEGGV